MKKLLTCVLALIMVLSIMTGCSGSPTTTGSQNPTTQQTTTGTTENSLAYLNLDSTMPIINEGYDVTLKIAAVQGDSWSAKPADHYLWAFFEEYCNLNLDVTYYKSSSWADQRNLMFTSGDLPDILFGCSFKTDELVKYGQVEGMLYPLDEVIPDYAPLIVQAGEEYPSLYAETKTPDGHMYALPQIYRADNEFNTSRVFIHQTWLDALQLPAPQTLDDLITVLTAFKNDDPNGNGQKDEIPMLGFVPQGNSSNAAVIVLTALGINTTSTVNFYTKDDGSINLGVMDDNYIHYLEYMKQLLAEGLLDQDYYTMTEEEFNAKLAQNTVGLAPMGAPYVYMPDAAQYQQYQALTPLTSAYNSTKIWPVNSNISQGAFAISYNTEYPEACIRMANVFFEKGINLLAFVGPLTSDTLEPQYPVDGWEATKCAIVDGAWTFTTSDGTDLWTYLNNKVGVAVQVGPCYTQTEADQIMGGSVPLADNETFWRNSLLKNVAPYEKLWLPTLFLDADALERANELKTPIVDYITTMEAKFIMGEESLDNMDSFYAQLKTLGIEEYIQIYQTAYDAYLANQ